MRILCPYCGWRDHAEFDHHGAADATRPAPEAPIEAWLEYVYLRDNPRGPYREYWQHVRGCRTWLRVSRDTLTHEVLTSEFANRHDAAEGAHET